MSRTVSALLAALGFAALAGGFSALQYGVFHPGSTLVSGLGPLNGVWQAGDYAFMGGCLAAAGAGLAAFALLARRRDG